MTESLAWSCLGEVDEIAQRLYPCGHEESATLHSPFFNHLSRCCSPYAELFAYALCYQWLLKRAALLPRWADSISSDPPLKTYSKP